MAGPPGGRWCLLVLLVLRYLLPTGGILHLGTRGLISLVAVTGILGDHHVPTSRLSAERMYPDVLVSTGRSPGSDLPSRAGTMSDSSADAKRQRNKVKLIRGTTSSPSSGPPVRPDASMSSQRPGARGQGWDPGGSRPWLPLLPAAQPHHPLLGLDYWPGSHTRTRDSLGEMEAG